MQIVAINEVGRGAVVGWWLCAVVEAWRGSCGGCRCCDGVLYRSATPCTHYFFARKFLFFFGGVGVGCLRRCAVSGCRVPCGGVVFLGGGAPRGRGCQGCEGKDPKGTPYAPRAGPRPKPLLHSTIVYPHLFCASKVFRFSFALAYIFCAMLAV